VNSTMRYPLFLLALTAAAVSAAGCSDFARQGKSPSQLVIVRLETPAVEIRELQGGTGVPGRLEEVEGFGVGPLYSDIDPVGANKGRVVLRQILRDSGSPGAPTTPSSLNDVTITEYEVRYRLANGRNTPGVDVPFPIRGGLTFTIQGTSAVTAEFELVRHIAKMEAPLAALRFSNTVLTVIADVTFYGRDQAGNAVSTSGSVQINFANFGN